jgi:hypothetical protein
MWNWLDESVGRQRKDKIFTWWNSLGLEWISLALIVSIPHKTPTQYQHRPIRVEGKCNMKPDRRIHHKISINLLKCFQKLHGTEWICWTLKKGQNIYLMEFTGSRMNEFPYPLLHPFPTKHLRNISIDPSDPTQPFTKDSAQIQSYEKTCFTDKWIFWHDSQASLAASNGWVIKMRHARNDWRGRMANHKWHGPYNPQDAEALRLCLSSKCSSKKKV